MARVIQIAPNLNEVCVTDKSISTTWGNRPRYNAPLKALRKRLGDNEIAESFCMAIAMSSYDWQVKRALNDFFHLDGTIDHV